MFLPPRLKDLNSKSRSTSPFPSIIRQPNIEGRLRIPGNAFLYYNLPLISMKLYAMRHNIIHPAGCCIEHLSPRIASEIVGTQARTSISLTSHFHAADSTQQT